MTMVTSLAVSFIKVNKTTTAEEEESGLFAYLTKGYDSFLQWIMRFPYVFVLLIVGMFFGSLMLFPKITFLSFSRIVTET